MDDRTSFDQRDKERLIRQCPLGGWSEFTWTPVVVAVNSPAFEEIYKSSGKMAQCYTLIFSLDSSQGL